MTDPSNSTPKSVNFYNSPFNGNLPQRVFDRREIIPLRNDVLWRIERGAVRTLTWNEDGTYITLGYWGIGDVVGFPLSKVTPYQIECLTTTEVTVIPPHLWCQDINNLLSHIQQSEELLSILNCKGISVRMWRFLVWFSEKFGQDVEKGKLIDLKITHQDIADVLNTTRVTVTRLLIQLEEDGKLTRHKRQMVLTSQNQCRKTA
jgi:CRP-like cAMP-binding protein